MWQDLETNDGITYANDCIFGIAQYKNASLSIVSQGQCEIFIQVIVLYITVLKYRRWKQWKQFPHGNN
jgi:ABC-type enterochelin transport system permease subunit